MPRTPSQNALDRRIQDIIGRAAHEIAVAVRADIGEQIARLVGGRRGAGAALELSGATGLGRKRRTILCPVPGCGKPGGGPKWGWFCAEHKSLPKAEQERYRAQRKAQQSGGAVETKAESKPARGKKR